MNRQHGTSLAEMLVALVSSSLLILILMNQYLGIKRHYQRTEHRLENAMDVQLISDLIRDSTRQSGFTPCLGLDHLTTIDTRNRRQGLISIEIQPGENAGFQINHMSDHYDLLINQTSSASWTSAREASYLRQSPVLISDCYHAEVHTIERIRSVNGHSVIRLNQPMEYTYVPPIYIGEWLEERFYVRQGVLFYKLRHADALSTAVNHWSVSLIRRHEKRMVNLVLVLEDSKSIQLDTQLRIA